MRSTRQEESNIVEYDLFEDTMNQLIPSPKTNYQRKLAKLGSFKKLLDPQKDIDLLANIATILEYASNTNLKVSVLGSFNRGKSTLLNALLGQKILPTALIPTTGASIEIKYGEELRTRILFTDGTSLDEEGRDALERFSRLNRDREMRTDILAVEVFVPHPLLKNGLEFNDLPGTNDREEQDVLVHNHLLSSDLILSVLDARQLMTLDEANNLQSWLFKRGIKSVIFVVNFLNLLEEEEQKEVMERAISIAEEFRGDFPDHFSNLYRVDALPALKAKQKEDLEAILQSGIISLESALQSITNTMFDNLDQYRLPRITPIYDLVRERFNQERTKIEAELRSIDNEQEKKRTKLAALETNFQKSKNELKIWISSDNTLKGYKKTLIEALRNGNFYTWKNNFQSVLNNRIRALNINTEKASTFNNQAQTPGLSIALPDKPSLNLPTRPEFQEKRTKRSIGIATGVGWVLAGPIGGAIVAGATHLVNEQHKKSQEEIWNNYYSELSNTYERVAKKYMNKVTDNVTKELKSYEKNVKVSFTLAQSQEPVAIKNKRNRVLGLQQALIS
ncbi:MAG: dynamin family protein [Cyanobacteria bacterium P01_F01_bin.143]